MKASLPSSNNPPRTCGCETHGTFGFPKPPNRFLQLLKKVAIVIITRIARCCDKTNPAAYMVGGSGFCLGAVLKASAVMMQNTPPTLLMGVIHATWTGLWLAFLVEVILYGMWEIVQGLAWLKEWATSWNGRLN